MFRIGSIEYLDDEVVRITDTEGNVVEALDELS
jgi:hypothetical protein